VVKKKKRKKDFLFIERNIFDSRNEFFNRYYRDHTYQYTPPSLTLKIYRNKKTEENPINHISTPPTQG
jgi:hypothetical protein